MSVRHAARVAEGLGPWQRDVLLVMAWEGAARTRSELAEAAGVTRQHALPVLTRLTELGLLHAVDEEWRCTDFGREVVRVIAAAGVCS